MYHTIHTDVRYVCQSLQFTLKCSAIGEPVPNVKITDEPFEPDLAASASTGQLGMRTATKVYTAVPGITPPKVRSMIYHSRCGFQKLKDDTFFSSQYYGHPLI